MEAPGELSPSSKKLALSPTFVRVVPFAVFLALSLFQTQFQSTSRFWIYLLKTVIGAWFIWQTRPLVKEMRWKVSALGIGVGTAVFVMWVGIDPFYRHIGGSGAPWNPLQAYSNHMPLAWMFVFVRLAGSTVVVPPLEEVFYRSFFYRYWADKDFMSWPMDKFHLGAFVVTSLAFGFEHTQWLAGILCGVAFQAVVLKTKRLGDAMTAHGVTNLLLGLWVVLRPAWQFW